VNEWYEATQAQSSQPISFPVVSGHNVDIGCFATETNNKDVYGLLILLLTDFIPTVSSHHRNNE